MIYEVNYLGAKDRKLKAPKSPKARPGAHRSGETSGLSGIDEPANIPLYRRHGFEVLGTIQVEDAPPLFPMLRQPR